MQRMNTPPKVRPPLRVTAVQFRGKRGGVEARREALTGYVKRALEGGARLVVTPELCCTGYIFRDAAEARHYAEDHTGPLARALAPLAAAHGAWVVAGVIEQERGGGHLYNSALIATPEGEVSFYRKRLLFEEDTRWARAGEPLDGEDPYPLLSVEGWRVTVGICMDLNDERFTRFCARERVEVIAFPTNWVSEDLDVLPYWAWRLRGCAATLVAANTFGIERQWGRAITFSGHSAILNAATADLLALAPRRGDGLLTADLA
jgi:predicted amidohydrolase